MESKNYDLSNVVPIRSDLLLSTLVTPLDTLEDLINHSENHLEKFLVIGYTKGIEEDGSDAQIAFTQFNLKKPETVFLLEYFKTTLMEE